MSLAIQLSYDNLKEKAVAVSRSNAAKVTAIWLSWLLLGAAFYATKANLGKNHAAGYAFADSIVIG